MNELVTIYGLCHPVTRDVRYVGQSVDPDARLAQHIAEAGCGRNGKASRKDLWISSLLFDGTRPLIESLALVPAEIADNVERLIIGLFDREGELLNIKHRGALNVGGAGMLTVQDIERFLTSLDRRGRILVALCALGWSRQETATRSGYALPTIRNALSNMQKGVYRDRVFDRLEELIKAEKTV